MFNINLRSAGGGRVLVGMEEAASLGRLVPGASLPRAEPRSAAPPQTAPSERHAPFAEEFCFFLVLDDT